MPASSDPQTSLKPSSGAAPASWLVRIPEVFHPLAEDIIARLRPMTATRLGNDYWLLKRDEATPVHDSEAAVFLQWNLPVHHSWPCNPQKMDGFIEKAAQTMLRKFGDNDPQGIFMGQLHPTPPNPYYKSLASNLRGRTLQLFPKRPISDVEEQQGRRETLFALVGKEGLFCGVQSPIACNGLYPGGSRYISQDSDTTISRAGAKIAEALHYVLMHRPALPAGSHWVELGASPGGMTSELLARDFRVTAVDRAPLDARLDGRKGLVFAKADVAEFKPRPGTHFDAILCDLNGDALDSIAHVIRISAHMKRGGLVVFTLKMPGIETVDAALHSLRAVADKAARAGLALLARTHLTYNRHEFTLFFTKDS